MVHIESVSIIYTAIEFITLCRIRIETFLVADYCVIGLLRGAI